MSGYNITLRELNRATLARQMLLERSSATALAAIEALAGLQAQEARPPYIGLWSRLRSFEPSDLTTLLHDRSVVRATTLRGTLHLHTARHYMWIRPTLQPALTAGLQSVLRGRLDDVDVAASVEAGRAFFGGSPQPFEPLRVHLAATGRFSDVRAAAYAVRMKVPLVQVPSEARWGFASAAPFALAHDWLGGLVDHQPEPERLALCYLEAFGPASAADAVAWSGMKELRTALESLRPRLVTFRDERGRELFDVPDGPRPPADVPAPVRFLPDFDNLLLAHADRKRIVADAHRRAFVTPNLRVNATFLVDGMVAGTWSVACARRGAVLSVAPIEPLASEVRDELAREGEALLRFAGPDASSYDVNFRPHGPLV